MLCGVYWLVTLPIGLWLGLHVYDEPLAGTLGFWKAMILGVAITGVILTFRLRAQLRKPLEEQSALSATEFH